MTRQNKMKREERDSLSSRFIVPRHERPLLLQESIYMGYTLILDGGCVLKEL